MNPYSSSPFPKNSFINEHYKLAKEVLIISTDEFTTQRIAKYIDECYHQCLGVVSNFIKAERQIEIKSPDLILINMDLEGAFSGFETAKVLNLEYDIPLVLYGPEKHIQMEYWVKEIQPVGELYLNTSDFQLKANLEKILN